MSFLKYVILGLGIGSVYAIIALGYTMVYGIAKMLNFAHGDIIMIGGFVAYTTVSYMGYADIAGIILAIVFCMLLGVTTEFVAYRPLRGASSLAVLITAIGVSYLLQNIALLKWGANAKTFQTVIKMDNLSLFDGKLVIQADTLVTIITCVVIMVALTLFVNKTKVGTAMRILPFINFLQLLKSFIQIINNVLIFPLASILININ